MSSMATRANVVLMSALAAALSAAAASLPIAPLDGWPKGWSVCERADRANKVAKTANGVRLESATVETPRFPCVEKSYRVSVRARGAGGRLRVFFPQYLGAKTVHALTMPMVMEIKTGESFQDYVDVFEIAHWRTPSQISVVLDGLGVEVSSISVEKVATVDAGNVRPPTVVTVPLAGEPFVFDGVFRRGYFDKWGVSIRNGFRDIHSGNVFPRQSECCLAADRENLYLAILHPVPPGGVVCNHKKHDDPVWMDDSTELTINPSAADANPARIYQIISNFRGVTFDKEHDLSIGQFHADWTCKGYEARRGSLEKPEKEGGDFYVLLARIPFASVGIADPSVPFGLSVGRNFANPQEFADLHGGGYQDFASMLRCSVREGAPAVSWGINYPTDSGSYRVDLSLRGGRIAGSASIVSKIPEVSRKGNFSANVGFSETIDLTDRKLPNGMLVAEAKDESGKTIFAHTMVLDTSNFSPQSARVSSAKGGDLLAVEHYPFQRKINLRWKGMGAKEQKALFGAEIAVTGPDGVTKTNASPSISLRPNLANVKFDFTPWKHGVYSVRGRAFDAAGRTIATGRGEFATKEFEWLGNRLGCEDVVVPPYTAMRTKGRTVSCLMRDTTFGANGLPSSVVASGGNVLSAPASFVVETANGVLAPVGSSFKMVKSSDTRVEFESGTSFAGLDVSLSAWMEYDGVLWYKMRLSPKKPLDLRRFALRLPYAEARLLHFYGASLRSEVHYHDLDKDFPGTGRIWDSSKYRNPRLVSTFMPFVWLGSNERGLMWFAESDRGWANDETSRCYEISRDAAGRVALDVNFVSVPTTLEGDREIEFGLLANPLKPTPVGAVLNYRWGSTIGYSACSREAEVFDPYLANRVIPDGTNASFVVYLAGQEYVKGDSEMKYAYDEFASFPRGAYTLSLPHRKYRTCGPEADSYMPIVFDWTQEFTDFLVWRMHQFMSQTRLDGIYMDNSYPYFVSDEMKTRKLWYERPDGRIQPGCDILNMRQMFKRVSVIAHRLGKRHPRIVVHNTGAQFLPRFTFADVAFGGEMGIPKEGKGDHFSVFYSAWPEVMLGVDWGFGRGMLTMLGPQAKSVRQTRAMLACYRIYDLAFWNNGVNDKTMSAFRKIDADFGVNAPDCRFTMWRRNGFVRFSEGGGDVRASMYARPGRRLIYMANQSAEPRRARFALGAKGVLRDAETGVEIAPGAGGAFSVEIGGHDLRAMVFEEKR